MLENIYISKRCSHCHELLILLHKHKHIFKFNIIDVDTNQYPNIIKSVPCMIVENKVLPGIELFKFLNYLIEEYNKENSISSNQNTTENNNAVNESTNESNDSNNSSEESNNDSLQGFCFGNSECLLFSSFDDNNHTMCNYETLKSNNDTKSCSLSPPENTKSDKGKEFNDDLSRLTQERESNYMR